MAVDAVLGEPVSGPIPCYQGNLQGISAYSPRELLAKPLLSDESMRLTGISVKTRLKENRELIFRYQGIVFA